MPDHRLRPKHQSMPLRKGNVMKRLWSLLTVVFVLPTAALAAGTPAGTPIANQASVSYEVNSTTITQNSNTVTLTVAELLNLTLTWQDATNIVVRPGDTGQMLTFLLTNTGNGSESFRLDLNNAVAVGDNFDPTGPSSIYLDSNGNGIFDSGIDTAYDAASNIPLLGPDAGMTLFVFNAIPADPGGPADGATAISRLTATSATGSGAPGTAFANQGGSGSVDAVVGTSGGTAATDGLYQVSRMNLNLTKSAVVDDGLGGSQPVPGAAISYTLSLAIAGSGTAQNIVISDTLPAQTTYSAGSLALDGVTLSDAADADAGEVVETPPASGIFVVTLRLGTITGAANHNLTFDVTIK